MVPSVLTKTILMGGRTEFRPLRQTAPKLVRPAPSSPGASPRGRENAPESQTWQMCVGVLRPSSLFVYRTGRGQCQTEVCVCVLCGEAPRWILANAQVPARHMHTHTHTHMHTHTHTQTHAQHAHIHAQHTYMHAHTHTPLPWAESQATEAPVT